MVDLSFFTTLEQRVVLLAVLGITNTDFSDSESRLGSSSIVAQTKQVRLVPMNISKKIFALVWSACVGGLLTSFLGFGD